MAVTGSVRDCICGATDVPVGWSWGLYPHVADRPFGAKREKGEAARMMCRGESPADHFDRMLRNAEMMSASPGYRYSTDAEIEEESRENVDKGSTS